MYIVIIAHACMCNILHIMCIRTHIMYTMIIFKLVFIIYMQSHEHNLLLHRMHECSIKCCGYVSFNIIVLDMVVLKLMFATSIAYMCHVCR